MKYAVPAGSARIKLLIALAARYTGCTARGWDVWDGLDTHPAFQISGRFGYSFGKTRVHALEGQLRKFEEQYRLRSEDFYRLVQEGRLEQSADFIEWLGLYEIKCKREQSLINTP